MIRRLYVCPSASILRIRWPYYKKIFDTHCLWRIAIRYVLPVFRFVRYDQAKRAYAKSDLRMGSTGAKCDDYDCLVQFCKRLHDCYRVHAHIPIVSSCWTVISTPSLGLIISLPIHISVSAAQMPIILPKEHEMDSLPAWIYQAWRSWDADPEREMSADAEIARHAMLKKWNASLLSQLTSKLQ